MSVSAKSLVVKAAVLLVALSSCAQRNTTEEVTARDLTLWNTIVKKEFFQSIAGPGMFSTLLKDSKIVYVFVYQPPLDDPDHILSTAIEVSSAGTLLNKEEYRRAVVATPLSERAREFPLVGSRAQNTAVFFGPGGSSYGLVSTTNDERFDVKVNVSQNGTASNVNTVNPREISLRLHQAYDALVADTM